MSHRYSTALSHIVLAGTGIYCLHRFHSGGTILKLPYGTFGIIITHSLIGIWRWGHPDFGENVDGPYHFTQFLQTIFAMPCIAGQIWMNLGYQKELGYLHPGVSLLPLAAYLAEKRNRDLIDLILAVNVTSCIAICIIAENYYGVAAGVAFAINHFIIQDEGERFDIPSQDLYNYALAFFTYFSFRALTH